MVKNRIKEIMKNKNLADVRPSKTLLYKWGVDIHSWNKWVKNSKNPPFEAVPDIAKMLNCDINELFKVNEESRIQAEAL